MERNIASMLGEMMVLVGSLGYFAETCICVEAIQDIHRKLEKLNKDMRDKNLQDSLDRIEFEIELEERSLV